MADTDVQLALERIREKIAALNFATDAILALIRSGQVQSRDVEFDLRRLSARRTDLRDERMTIILTQSIADPPSANEIKNLRQRVKELYLWNAQSDAINDLIAGAIAIATS